MTYEKASVYFETLTDAQRTRFNILVDIGLTLGKPVEGAYSYAHTVMEEGE